MKGRTLKSEIEFTGRGLFSGSSSKVKVFPLVDKVGIFFRKVSGNGQNGLIPLSSISINTGYRSSAIVSPEFPDVEIRSVEHLLSSLYGLKVTSAIIEVEGDELPALDGSAKLFADAIKDTGLVDTQADIEVFDLQETICERDNDSFIVATPLEGRLLITVTIDYPQQIIGKQTYSFEFDETNYMTQIAPARTFCMKSEADIIIQRGLGKGATEENTIIIEEADPKKLRYPDEFVRHKVLDLIGDISAVGCMLGAHIVAYKSGHTLNHKLVKRIRELVEKKSSKSKEVGAPLLDIREIFKFLPHRYPMLLIDRVVESDGYNWAKGLKNVTINEPFFMGHFPNNPVMPGVLILEAMAQLAGALLMRKSENFKRTPILISMDNVRFRKQVVPGDQLSLYVEAKRIKARTCDIYAKSTVNDQLAAESDMKFMLIDADAI